MVKAMYVCSREIKISGRVLRIARLDAESYHFLSDPFPLIGRLRECGRRIDLFTFDQSSADRNPRFSYPMEWENHAVLPVSTFENWWTNQVGRKVRHKVRQAAEKGVVVREVELDERLVRGIWEIYNECPVRQGRRFPHYGEDLETVRKEESTYLDSSTFLGAFLGEELIGFIKFVTDETGAQAGFMNILSKMRHWDKSPTIALVAEAVRYCADRGISYLDYGYYSYGKKRWDGLMQFKKQAGFQRIDLPRYYVPLTGLGRVALRLGLHHRLVDWLPESQMSKLRELRRSLYKRKNHSDKEVVVGLQGR
jgi:hypothetical protein